VTELCGDFVKYSSVGGDMLEG